MQNAPRGLGMQYAQIGVERREAFPGGRGTCPICGASTVAKCGRRVIHHWAHATRRDCDPWWENETDWHREWKSLFPEECREISYTVPDGEIHRADLVTPTGIVIGKRLEFPPGAADARDTATNEGGGRISRWPVRVDAGSSTAAACRGNLEV